MDDPETPEAPAGMSPHLFTSSKASEAAKKRWANARAQGRPEPSAATRRRYARKKRLLQGAQPREMAVGLQVQSADPTADIEDSSASGRDWKALLKERMKGRVGNTIPPEALAKYPEGDFCWARKDADCISEYQSNYGYDIVRLDTPLQGQADTTITHRDAILMVRSQDLRRLHDEARAELLQERYGDAEGYSQQAERDAQAAAAAAGYKPRDVRGLFFEERINDAGDAAARAKADAIRRTMKGAAGRGSRYVPGGIPS